MSKNQNEFGYLAQFRLVIWRTFVWLFGANHTGTIIISQKDFIKFWRLWGIVMSLLSFMIRDCLCIPNIVAAFHILCVSCMLP